MSDNCIEMWQAYKKRRARAKKMGIKLPALFSGLSLFSASLPGMVFYKGEIKIEYGIALEGILNYRDISGGLISYINTYYNPSTCLEWIGSIQMMTLRWLSSYKGFSAGIGDCMLDIGNLLKNKIEECKTKISMEESSQSYSISLENRVNNILMNITNLGEKIASQNTREETLSNGLMLMIKSGSKGNHFNLCQMTTIVGQQLINNQRMPGQISYGKRTSVHIPIPKEGQKLSIEEKGFISHSFLRGLDPFEYWSAARSGRHGIVQQKLNTSKTGYTERKMVKSSENCIMAYDGTVRMGTKIIQFRYGEDGMDPSKLVGPKEHPSFIDCKAIADKMNAEYEMTKD